MPFKNGSGLFLSFLVSETFRTKHFLKHGSFLNFVKKNIFVVQLLFSTILRSQKISIYIFENLFENIKHLPKKYMKKLFLKIV